MSLFRGDSPRHIVHVHRDARLNHLLAAALTVLLVTIALTFQASAQETAGLSLAEAEQLALDQEPGQLAFLARAEALRDQSIAAGQLPDPKLRMGLANYPLESGGFSTEGMTQAQLGIRQSFPPGRSRAVRTRQFQSLADEMTENAEARGRDVLSSVRNAWLDAYYWSRAYEIVSESRPFFGDLVTVTRSLYSVGRKSQQDVLRADLEISRLDDRLIEINRRRAAARAALAEWIGDASVRPLANKLPVWSETPKLDELHANLQTHPVLKAAAARIASRRAAVDLAKESYKPGWALDLGYAYRDGTLPTGDSRSDFVSLSVTVDLPVFRKNRQDRKLSAALSERRAADESKEQLARRLLSQLDAEYARWTDLNRRVELYDSVILTQVEDHARAAMTAYQAEAGDFADVMRGFINELNTRLEYIRLQVEQAQSYAVLANLGGLPR